MNNRYSKPVAFNRNNAVDQLIEQYVRKKNFSGMCKKLIIEKMKEEGIDVPRRRKTPRIVKIKEDIKSQALPPQKESAAEKLVRLQEELKQRTNNVDKNTDSSTNS